MRYRGRRTPWLFAARPRRIVIAPEDAGFALSAWRWPRWSTHLSPAPVPSLQAPSRTDYVLHPSIPVCLPAFKLAPGLSRVEEGRQTCRPDGGMDGWQHLLRRQRSLQSEARSEHHRRARPSSPLASRPPPMSVAASFSPHHGRCLRPRHHGCRGNSKEHKPVQWGRCPPLSSSRPAPAMDPGESGGLETETRDCDRMTGSRGKRGEREYKGRQPGCAAAPVTPPRF